MNIEKLKELKWDLEFRFTNPKEIILRLIDILIESASAGGDGGDLSKCPKCGGEADNGHDRSYPPVPYYCSKCESQDSGGLSKATVGVGGSVQSSIMTSGAMPVFGAPPEPDPRDELIREFVNAWQDEDMSSIEIGNELYKKAKAMGY